MSWMQKLYETYENCASAKDTSLLSICHTTQKAQIEIIIDNAGNFNRARVIAKDQARTIIPCTESSGGRAGIKPEAHPLCDKLQYLAGDFAIYGGEVTKGYAKNPTEPYEKYTELLQQWCDSEFTHPKAKAVFEYVKKGNLIKDLVESKVLFLDDNKKLLKEWRGDTKQEVPEIFKVTQNSIQGDAFARWIIEIPTDPQSAVWTDESLFDSWTRFYLSTKKTSGLCLVTGVNIALSDQHPAKIRNDGDKAKLISSNDISGFTFRGRFLSAEQACGVGFEVTQKAHNALRWLINRQGYRRGDLAIVAWSTVGKKIIDPLADPYSIFNIDEMESDSEILAATTQELAIKLNKKIAGYQGEIGNTAGVVVMGLDSATPGRMAMTFYRELTDSDFLHRIEDWHKSCCWIHNYHSKEIIDKKQEKSKKSRFDLLVLLLPMIL